MTKFKCNLCGGTFKGYGNNPYPLCHSADFDSRCCDACNSNYVIPARIYMMGIKMSTEDHDKWQAEAIKVIHTKEGVK